MRRLFGLLVPVLLLAGCAANEVRSGPSPQPSTITVAVVSRNWEIITIHYFDGTRRRRLDQVNFNDEKLYVVPTPDRGDIRFYLDLLASPESFLTNGVTVRDGTTVVLEIMNDLDSSSVWAR